VGLAPARGGVLSAAEAVGRERPEVVVDDPVGRNTQRVARRQLLRLEARNDTARLLPVLGVDDSVHEHCRNVRGRGFG